MDSVYCLLQDNDIELVLLKLEKNGYYDPKSKAMFINQDLDEENQKEVILHELGHALNHADLSFLYDKPVFHSKMENEATYYMVNYLIDESGGQFNYSDVLNNFKLGLGWEAKIKRP